MSNKTKAFNSVNLLNNNGATIYITNMEIVLYVD